MLPGIAFALVSSSLLYLTSPRFPHYQITKFRIIKFSIIHFLVTFHISCMVEVEVTIDNVNFIGAQVYNTLVDMYYPDLKRNLHHVGYLRDKHNHNHNHNHHYHYRLLYEEDDNVEWKKKKKKEEENDEIEETSGPPSPMINNNNNHHHFQKNINNNNPNPNPNPAHLPARKTVLMYDNIITVEDLGPITYLSMIWDIIKSGGELDLLSTGVAHIKTQLIGGGGGGGSGSGGGRKTAEKDKNNNNNIKNKKGGGGGGGGSVPLTVTVLCENRIDIIHYFPAKIIERTCAPVDVSPGWLNMEKERLKLQDEIMWRYNTTKSVLRIRGGVDMLGGQKRDDIQAVEHWHDF